MSASGSGLGPASRSVPTPASLSSRSSLHHEELEQANGVSPQATSTCDRCRRQKVSGNTTRRIQSPRIGKGLLIASCGFSQLPIRREEPTSRLCSRLRSRLRLCSQTRCKPIDDDAKREARFLRIDPSKTCQVCWKKKDVCGWGYVFKKPGRPRK